MNTRNEAPIDWAIAGFWGSALGACVAFWTGVGLFLSGGEWQALVGWSVGVAGLFAGLCVENVRRHAPVEVVKLTPEQNEEMARAFAAVGRKNF